MKVLLILGCIALAQARILNTNNCDGIIVDNINYEKVILKEKVDKPYQMSIDYNTNILYFSYTSMSMHGQTEFEMAYLNLKTNEFGIITGIEGPFASAVEEKSHHVYFGGSDGIYQLQPSRFTAAKVDLTDMNIWQMFYKDGLYFTTYPDEEAFVYKEGRVRRVTEVGESKAMLIAVGNSNNIYYSNSSGLFVHTKDGKTDNLGDHTLNGFTSDIDGNLFFSTPTGIFKIEEKTNTVKKLASIINIYGVAIESDGSIIYAEDNAIVRLKSTGQECFADHHFS